MDSQKPSYVNEIFIFDAISWRNYAINFKRGNRTALNQLCTVPQDLRHVLNEICHAHHLSECDRFPCDMIHADMAGTHKIQCYRGGRSNRTWLHETETSLEPSFSCQIGPSLDLFRVHNNNSVYPSMIIHGYDEILRTRYVEAFKQLRSKESVWGLYFNLESLSYYPWAGDPKIVTQFNITLGYDRQIYDVISSAWLFPRVERLKPGPNRMTSADVLNSKKPIIGTDTGRVNRYWPTMNTFNVSVQADGNSFLSAPILWMNSNCATISKRTEYIEELRKYIDVDNYGNCGSRQLPLPKTIIEIQQSRNRDRKNQYTYNWEDGKLALAKSYLFTIAIENSINFDYITEKLWHPLMIGSIPIYLGAPNIDDWLPCNSDCIIDLRRFPTPKAAAKYIHQIAMNKSLYESFHRWREEPIRDKFQSMLDYFERAKDYDISCMVCDASHRARRDENLALMKNEIRTRLGKF